MYIVNMKKVINKAIHLAVILMVLYSTIIGSVFVVCVGECEHGDSHTHLSVSHDQTIHGACRHTSVNTKLDMEHPCIDYALMNESIPPAPIFLQLFWLSLLWVLVFLYFLQKAQLTGFVLKDIKTPRLFCGISSTVIRI